MDLCLPNGYYFKLFFGVMCIFCPGGSFLCLFNIALAKIFQIGDLVIPFLSQLSKGCRVEKGNCTLKKLLTAPMGKRRKIMEPKKIAIACFLGGAICVTLALIFTPKFWWLGMIAGFAVGYLAYDLVDVLRIVPSVFIATKSWVIDSWQILDKRVIEWSSLPHPIYYPSAFLSLGIVSWILRQILSSNSDSVTNPIVFVMAWMVNLSLLFLTLSLCFCIPIAILAFLGARYAEKCYWTPLQIFRVEENEDDAITKLKEGGFVEKPLSYKNTFYWGVKGVLVIFRFFFWTLLKYLIVLLKYLIVGIFIVVPVLLFWAILDLCKEIHSQKRVLCGFYASLGGAIAYLLFAGSVSSIVSQIVLILFGGCLGAFLGAISWEFVSKRLLKIPN